MAGNPRFPESTDFHHLEHFYARVHAQASFHSAREPIVMHFLSWVLFIQRLILPCVRNEDKMVEMVGNPRILESPDRRHLWPVYALAHK